VSREPACCGGRSGLTVSPRDAGPAHRWPLHARNGGRAGSARPGALEGLRWAGMGA